MDQWAAAAVVPAIDESVSSHQASIRFRDGPMARTSRSRPGTVWVSDCWFP
jgi:hypothetical protein